MTREEKELALYCLKVSSDYHSEVCEECINYPNCDHMIQDDVTGTIIKELEQEPILDKIRAEIENHCGLAKENHCKYCPYCNSVMGVREILKIFDKYKESDTE